MSSAIALAFVFSTTVNDPSMDLSKVDFAARFGKFDGCFVIKEVGTGPMRFHKEQDCKRRLAPCSTFKIFNALAALDAGAVKGPDTLLKWDGTPNRRKECEKDHTLASAIRDSVVWYFQEVARRIGPERMQRYLDGCDYGNRDISAGIDTFWLETSLRISAVEQLRFMERLYTDKLPFTPEAMQAVREMIVLRRGDGWTFSGKTGTGAGGTDGAALGWFVGHIRSGERQFVLVANIRGEGARGPTLREMAFDTLKDLGLIEDAPSKAP